jgi:hypothetical protein
MISEVGYEKVFTIQRTDKVMVTVYDNDSGVGCGPRACLLRQWRVRQRRHGQFILSSGNIHFNVAD